MLKLAVFGHPISHSLSPRIHGMFAEAAGMDVVYDRIDCPAGKLARALEAFRADGGQGCNLTVPLKSEGLALADDVAPDARDAGACNTLVWRDKGWFADNTDGAGLMADLERLGLNIAERRVLVLGAGGAVAGVLGPLLNQRPARVRVLNRSIDRARSLADRFSGRGPLVEAHRPNDMPGDLRFDLVIQGTSLGHQGLCPEIRPEWLAEGATGYDLNYGPAYTPFAERCAELGISSHSGIGMLIEQAAVAFERFTGVAPDTREVHAELNHSAA